MNGAAVRFVYVPLAVAPLLVWDAAGALASGSADLPTVLLGAAGLTVSVLFLLHVRRPLL